VLQLTLAPGQPFALAQVSKGVGKKREPLNLQHERHPRVGNHELGKVAASLWPPDAPLKQFFR
jgi:hypothetical protein